MKNKSIQLGAAIALFTSITLHAATTHYVDLNCTNPIPPYTDWSTAATNIQDAIDASTNGDSVLVTNGVYSSGGRTITGYALTNRVVIDKAVTVQSVNGPGVTAIEGYQVPGTTNGDGAVRCIYLAQGAILSGFTLAQGATRAAGDYFHEQDGGGAWCESTNVVVTNCVFIANSAADAGGGASEGTLINCTLANNMTPNAGGGTINSVLNHCMLSGNYADWGGGGAYGGFLNDCTLSNNQANSWGGGGAVYSTLNRCSLIGNSVTGQDGQGGGTDNSYLTNCILASNTVTFGSGTVGGGASYSTVVNSLIYSNFADSGGGAEGCDLENCTLIGNTATTQGGGEDGSDFNNCIVYYNTAPSGANWYGSPCGSVNPPCASINYCCTIPLPGLTPGDGVATAVGNFTNEPIFVELAASNFHLQSNSPCINSGNNDYVTTTNDLDGNPRIVGGTVDIGAYEYQTPASVISYAWLQQYGLPTDGSLDYTNLDGTDFNVYQDWIAGLNPTNPASVLALQIPVATNNATGITVTWLSVSGITYFLERSTNLSSGPAFFIIQSNIVSQAGTTSYTDTTATNGGPYFYRVGVQ